MNWKYKINNFGNAVLFDNGRADSLHNFIAAFAESNIMRKLQGHEWKSAPLLNKIRVLYSGVTS